MTLWRISNHTDLSGEGGMRASGRWHSRGRPIVYLTESSAGAMLETLVHLKGRRDKIPRTYTLLQLEVPDTVAIEMVPIPTTENWKEDLQWSRKQGDEWLASGRTAMLEIPSVVMIRTTNYVFNPRHADADSIQVKEIINASYDERLFVQHRDEFSVL
jgi:RES domain-containing protein